MDSILARLEAAEQAVAAELHATVKDGRVVVRITSADDPQEIAWSPAEALHMARLLGTLAAQAQRDAEAAFDASFEAAMNEETAHR